MIRQIGKSDSTAFASNAAIKLYDAYRKLQQKPKFMEMDIIEIENDHLAAEILNFCQWISSTPIPRYFNEDLQPKKEVEGATQLLQASTLVKYVGKIIAQIRQKFPNHPDFQSIPPEEVPSWWTNLRPAFQTELTRFHMRLGSDFVFGESYTRPLYCKTTLVQQNHDTVQLKNHDFSSIIDLPMVCKKLMQDATLSCNHNGPLQQRCWLIFTFQAVGRGGEVKFQNFKEWEWHSRYEVLDIVWTELKLLEKYSMPMVPHKMHYICDFYHCLASFWSVENGLWRDHTMHKSNASYVFPDLHALNDSSVARKITGIIRDNIPAGCPDNIKKSYSAKSLCRGAITQLATHPGCSTMDVCGRSGHSTGTNLDSYLDQSYIVRGLRGAKVLNEYINIEAETAVPRLEALGSSALETMNHFISLLYINNIPQLQPMGTIHIVLRTCTASLIMHHQLVTTELGPHNAVSTKLRNTAREARLFDARYPNVGPDQILDIWSSIISDDYKARNPEVAKASPNAISMSTVINQHTEVLQSISQKLNDMITERRDLINYIATQSATITSFQTTVHKLQDQLNAANKKLSVLRTPPNVEDTFSPPSAKRLFCGTSETASEKQPGFEEPLIKDIYPLIYGAEAKEKAEATSEKNKYLSTVLIDLYHNGCFHATNILKHCTVPFHYQERQLVENCLELVDLVITDDEKKVLISKDASAEWLQTFGKNIEARCMLKLLEYEGLPDTKKTKKKATYLAIGQRIRKYKAELAKQTRNPKPNTEVLRDPNTKANTVSGLPIQQFFLRKQT